jgi:hypothetical protein
MADQHTERTTEKDPDDLSKADASKLIDELQDRTGRGEQG